MLKVYCEHGAVRAKLKSWQVSGQIELIHFPFDPNSKNKKVKRTAAPSVARWDDLIIPGDESSDLTFSDF
jgi:hypothetical protein